MTTLRDNTVTITGNSIVSITYVPNSLQVSSGQPSGDVTVSPPSGKTWTIDAKAGRHGTGAIAEAFNSACGGAQYEYCPTASFDSSPEDLNFFFGVIITMTTSAGSLDTNEVYLAQGSSMGRNNWWIGGNGNIYSDSTDGVATLYINDGENRVYTADISGETSSFNLSV